MRSIIGDDAFAEIAGDSTRSIGACLSSGGVGTNTQSVPKIHTKPLTNAIADYLAQKALENSVKTLKEKESTYNKFINLYGDIDTNSVSAETAISFKNRPLT